MPQDMADQLAAVNKERVQLQREFDAFKDLTAQVGLLAALHCSARHCLGLCTPDSMSILQHQQVPLRGVLDTSIPCQWITRHPVVYWQRPYRCVCGNLCLQTSRSHREEQARLLEENAALKARIAAEAARVAMGVLPGAGVGRPTSKTFAAVGDAGGAGGFMDAWLGKLERWVWR